MNNITMKNISSGTVVVSAPNIRFRRELTPGRVVSLTKEEYEELSFDTGFSALLNGHYIKLQGLEEDKQAVAIDGADKVFEMNDIVRMLDKLDITSFAKFLPSAAEAEKETVVKLAVEKGITNPGFTALIKKYCDVDIISAINMKHQAEE